MSKLTAPEQPTRFVVLHHTEVDHPHFDLMIEVVPGAMLQTWRSDTWPIARRTELIRLPDHRAVYLHFEGKLSANRGHVVRVDSGVGRAELDRYWMNDVSLEQVGSKWFATPIGPDKK